MDGISLVESTVLMETCPTTSMLEVERAWTRSLTSWSCPWWRFLVDPLAFLHLFTSWAVQPFLFSYFGIVFSVNDTPITCTTNTM